ncbi:MAG: SDR family NAD(P)-dependent oxidoreductase [Paracoccaceae bacterium]|jgi:NAD(P)-dependent dehydrogenase (short-subunit alcohol dehydrogenase family)
MNSYDFDDQVAVITGGAQGIGYAVAKRMIENGAKVVIWDFDTDLARASASELGATALHCDVSDWDSVQAAAQQTENQLGRIDVLVNSAGVAGANAVVEEYPIEEWNKIMSVNLNGTFHTNRAVIAGMKQRGYGRIVNIASIAGKEGNPNASAYSASKAGVIALTKSLGKEAADFNIGVNCVTPAAARTAIFDQMSEEHINYMLSKIPRNRFVDVAEVANMICWIASAENAFTTGAVFDLSGGRATY